MESDEKKLLKIKQCAADISKVVEVFYPGINKLIYEITRESKLSEWELEFINEIYDRFVSNRSISEKQYEKLCKIWEKVTS